MLESLVATVLNRVVGSYVENFDPNQLNIGLLSGDVKLRNLRFKRAALDKLHLPLNVTEGQIGSLVLQIPYSNLKNKPVKVLIEDVLILASPDLHPNDDDYNRRMQNAKLEKLEIWEVSQAAKPESHPDAPETSSFITKIIDNLQVTIKNIHIRYEDSQCVPDHPFAMGITLSELSAVSTTSNWEPAFISEVTSISHKLATLDSFAVYWDLDAKKMSVNDDEFRARITDVSGQYLLRPVNGQGYITLNKRPPNESTPKIHTDLQFEEFAIGLEGAQYRDILAVADQFQLYFRTREYRQFRPKASPKEDPRAWWKYAANTVLKNVQERTRVWNWDNFNQRMTSMKRYITLYEKQYNTSLTAAEKKEYDAVEEKYSYDDIVLFRSMAKVNIKHKAKPKDNSWTSWIWGKSPAEQNAETSEETDGPIELTDQQRQELMSIFDEPVKSVSENQILLSAEISLQSGSVRLKKDNSNDVAALFFNASKAKLIKRSDNLLFGISLESFGISDLCQDSKFPDVVKAYPRKGKHDDSDQLFWLMFEHNPLDDSADSTLSLKSKSVKIVYTSLFVERLVEFFTPPARSQAVDAIVGAASRTVEELREQTRLGLEYALQNHKSLLVKLDIDAPIIVVPEDPRDEDSGVLILDTGHLSLSSELASKDVIEEVKSKQAQKYNEKDWEKLESLMFDKFRISLVDAQILIGPRYKETVALIESEEHSKYHLLNKATFDFLLMVSIVPTVVTIPRCKIAVDLPNIGMYFADVQYKQLMRTLQSAVPKIQGPANDDEDERPVLHRRADKEISDATRQPKKSAVAQVLFELSLVIGNANLHVLRGWNSESIADISLNGLEIGLKTRDKTMYLGLTVLDFMIEDMINSSAPPELRKFIKSNDQGPENGDKSKLLTVDYKQTEGAASVEQSIDVNLASMQFIINPDSLLTVYDYIMSTFTAPEASPALSDSESEASFAGNNTHIHVKINLQSIIAKINEGNVIINTLELASARMTVDLLGAALKFGCILGAVSIIDDIDNGSDAGSVIRQLVSIDGGGDLADIRYETVPTDEYDAYVYFRSGSLKLSLVEEPIARLMRSLSRLLQMKAVYDQARMIAFDQAENFEPPERLKLDVVLKAPIVVFPRYRDDKLEIFSANLGEIFVQNSFDKNKVQSLEAGFRNLNIFTELYLQSDRKQSLEILTSVDLTVNATITQEGSTTPDSAQLTTICGTSKLNPTAIDLTEHQFQFIMACVNSVTELSTKIVGMDNAEVGNLREQLSEQKQLEKPKWNEPAPKETVQTIDFKFTAPSCDLKLYQETTGVITQDELCNHALSSFKLDSLLVNVQNDKKNNLSADFSVKSFTIEDLRPERENKFPQIIPAAAHDENQLMCRYTQSPNRKPNVDISLDGLRAIIAVDYLVALQKFFTIPDKAVNQNVENHAIENFETEHLDCDDYQSFLREGASQDESEHDEVPQQLCTASSSSDTVPITMSISIVDMYAILLADATKEDTEAVVFKIEHIVGSLNQSSSLGISKVGMYLTRMNSFDKDTLRLLDDFNITATSESIESTQHSHLSKIAAHIDPLVFRVSIREIVLAIDIVNRASALWAQPPAQSAANSKFSHVTLDGKTIHKSNKSLKRSDHAHKHQQPQHTAALCGTDTVLGEELQIETSGFRAVIIDTNHMPMIDFVIKPFNVRVHNWSSDLSADLNLQLYSNVYSFTKSAWEPLFDQVNMFLHMSKPHAEHAPVINIQTKNITNIDVTTEIIEMAEQLQTYFNQDPETIFSEERFIDGHPYRIVNQTGFDINVWSEITDSLAANKSAQTNEVVTIANGATEKWSFFDWRKIREVLGGISQEVNLGIEFKNSPFQPLHSVNVNLVGEHLFLLKPSTDSQHRLAVDIYVKDSLKYIVIRSTVSVVNATRVPLDIRLVSYGNEINTTIAAGDSYSAPILDVDAEVYVKPKNGEYGWSKSSIWWRELRKKEYDVECPGVDDSFYVHAKPYYPRDIPLQNHYPYMIINLVPPIELINNLPFDIDYRLYCKNTRVDWKNTIKVGELSQIHVVNRSQLLLLSIDPHGTDYQSEPAVINSASPDFNVEHILSLKNREGHRLKLNIGYVDMPKNRGSSIVIMAPYVILNSVGKKVTVATKLNRVHCDVVHEDGHTKLASRPYMWSFEHPDSKNKAVLKIEESGYTGPVNFTAIGTTSEVKVPSRDHRREMYLGVSLVEGEGRFKRTNVVKIAPRFILYNQLDCDILYKEPGELDAMGTLGPKSFEPVGFMSNMSNRQMCLSFSGSAAKWSSAFVLSNVGTSYVRLYQQNKPTTLIKVEVYLQESTLFVYLNRCTNWPYSIRNLTELEFEFFQANPYVDEDGIERKSFTPTKYRLPPYTAMPYSWDFPAAQLKELVLTHEGKQRKIQLAEIGELEPTKFPGPDGSYAVDFNVVANGPLQALVISPFSNDTSNYNLVRTNTRNSTSTGVDKFEPDESDDSESATYIQFELEGIGISYINSNFEEFCYASMRNITVIYRLSELYEYFAVKCQWFQVDNCLVADSAYPVMIYPTVLPRSGEEIQQHPVFSAAITRLNDDSYGLNYIKHATVLLQEMTIDIDEDILVSVLQMFKRPSEGEILRTDKSKLCQSSLLVPTPPAAVSTKDLYFELFHLQPLQFNLSFVRTGALTEADLFTSMSSAIGYVLDAATMAIGNINDAPIRLNALMIENLRTTEDHLQSCVSTHYSQELLYQLYKVVGSVDIIGNPVGLFNNLSSGVMDLFYEPYMGYTMTDRPQDLGIGIAKGGAMFLKKTVFGVSDSVSKVTGSISKGLLAVTMDSRYQRKQRYSRVRNRPSNALFGFGYGASSFANSLASGISGLALAPLEGATAEGAPGFFKGFAKGLLGLPTKTTIGVLDLASNISEGIRNNTTMFDNNTIMRIRAPRVIEPDHIIRPYSERDAIGQQLLHTMRDSKYKHDEYVAYTQISSGDVVIVSYEHIVCCRLEGLKEQWSVAYNELRSIGVENSGISLKLRDGVQGPFIPISQQDSRKYISKSIAKAVTAYNQRKATIS